MHHLGVKSNLVDTGAEAKLGFRCNNPPLCPKPRRLGSPVPEFLKTLGCNNHRLVFFLFLIIFLVVSEFNCIYPFSCFYLALCQISQLGTDGRNGILNMIITEKVWFNVLTSS